MKPRVGRGGRRGSYPPPDSLNANEPVGLQVAWWSVLLGGGKKARVERAIIHASGVRWRERIERLKREDAPGDGKPKNWTDVARAIRIHLSNATARGKHTHLAVMDVILVAGMLGVPCADLMPESYAKFVEDATSHLCGDGASAADIRAYAAYWAERPIRPRAGIDRQALTRAALQLRVHADLAEAAIRRVAAVLAQYLDPYRAAIEGMIAEGRLL